MRKNHALHKEINSLGTNSLGIKFPDSIFNSLISVTATIGGLPYGHFLHFAWDFDLF